MSNDDQTQKDPQDSQDSQDSRARLPGGIPAEAWEQAARAMEIALHEAFTRPADGQDRGVVALLDLLIAAGSLRVTPWLQLQHRLSTDGTSSTPVTAKDILASPSVAPLVQPVGEHLYTIAVRTLLAVEAQGGAEQIVAAAHEVGATSQEIREELLGDAQFWGNLANEALQGVARHFAPILDGQPLPESWAAFVRTLLPELVKRLLDQEAQGGGQG